MSNSKTRFTTPQDKVVDAALNDLEKLEDHVKIFLAPIVELYNEVKEISTSKAKKNVFKFTSEEFLILKEKSTFLKVVTIRQRLESLIQILRRDVYWKDLDDEVNSIFYEVVKMVEDAMADGNIEQARELAEIWEIEALNIFKHGYPRSQKFLRDLLQAIAKMHYIFPKGSSQLSQLVNTSSDSVDFDKY